MSAISSLLVRDDVVSVAKIEEALQRQVLEGGDIDTALLELDAVAENVLNAYRAAAFWLAPASREDLSQIPREVIKLVPRELAERHRFMPIRVEGPRLVIAAVSPLPAEIDQQLGFLLGYELEVHIATEVRVLAALARYHGTPLPDRMRRLATRLESRESGQMPEVRPPTLEELRRQSLTPTTDEELLRGLASEPPPGFDEVPNDTPDPSLAERFAQRATISGYPALGFPRPAAETQDAPGGFRHERTLTHGIPAMAATPPGMGGDGTAPLGDETDTAEGHVISSPVVPVGARPGAAQLTRKLVLGGPGAGRRGEGPLNRDVAITLLQAAPNRDSIVEVLFSFARQLFDGVALFAVREHEAHLVTCAGLGEAAADVDDIAFSLEEPGALSDARNTQLPHISELNRTPADEAIREELGRTGCQPAAIVPVTLRKRVVLLLYGDRAGERFKLEDIAELMDLLPRVGEAFERAIRNRKAPAVPVLSQPPRTGGASDRSSPDGTAEEAPATDATPEAAPRAARAQEDPAAAEAATAPTGSAAHAPPAEPDAASDDVTRRPTQVLPRAAPAERMPRVTRTADYAQPPEDRIAAAIAAASSERASEPAAPPGPRRRSGTLPGVTYPGLQPAAPQPGTAAAPEAREPEPPPDDEPEPEPRASPPPRMPSRPPAKFGKEPPGTGTYRLQDAGSDIVPSVRPPAPRPSDPPSAPPRASRPPRPDARREPGDGEVVAAEVIRVSKVPFTPLSEPPSAGAEPTPVTEEPSIVVDMGHQVDALVQELQTCGPDDEGPMVAALLRAGDAALPALMHAFPGPLWFEPYQSQSLPPGRSISAIARAFIAFGEAAVPYLASLFEAPEPERRYCATLLAADLVHPKLLEPLLQRVFDVEPQIRKLAVQTLLGYAELPDYAAAVEAVRGVARSPSESLVSRVAALEALEGLRDANALDELVALLDAPEHGLASAAHRALVSLTAQDFGSVARKWQPWLDKHRNRGRVEWLIDSLMHTDEDLRGHAGAELQRITRQYYGYHSAASKRERERVQRRYREWWQAQD